MRNFLVALTCYSQSPSAAEATPKPTPLPLDAFYKGALIEDIEKDHETLIRAIALLRDKNIIVPVLFAGAGNKRHIIKAKKLVDELQLNEQIYFAGHCGNLSFLLMRHQICVARAPARTR